MASRKRKQPESNNPTSANNRPTIQPTNTGTVLADAGLDEYLIGQPPSSGEMHDGLVTVSSFLRQHQFLSSGSGTESGANAGLATVYEPTMKEFTDSQFERQAAGLRSNTSGASADALTRLVDCHADALKHGLQSITTDEACLTNLEANLHAIHSKLCPDMDQSGQYRGSRVRAGNTSFVPPDKVKEEIDHLSVAVKRYQTKWASSSTAIMNEQQWCGQVYKKISLAAIVMFGIVDVHPFKDGNGRTARIYMSIALKKLLGLPFPVMLTATVHQRREYVDGIKDSRSRLQRISTSSTGGNAATNTDSPPVFGSLITVVFNRVLHAIRQANSLIETKTQAATRDEEARIARRVRERAATGQCVICLDENPNISTLCCGQIVHMTCLAEWLGNQGSCIGCRRQMPRLTQRTPRQEAPPPAANAPNDVGEEAPADTTTTEEDEEEPPADTTATEAIEEVPEEDTTTEEIEEEPPADTITEEVEEEPPADTTTEEDDEPPADTTAEEDEEEPLADTTTEEVEADDSTEVEEQNWNNAPDDTTIMDESIDTTESSTEDSVQQRPATTFCGQCQRNKFAVDCSNQLCGACCNLYGSMSCTRHNC